MSDIDFGQLAEALNDKSDRDLRNVDTTAKADAVIDFQLPTAENNYTWYRKYKSGWVEQGCNNPGTFGTITLPIEMADSYYNITITPADTYYVPRITARTSTSFSSNGRNIDNSNLSGNTSFVAWKVSGMAAN